MYDKTIKACFSSYVVQAIINNFVPLLFVMFHQTMGISMAHITLLVTLNFGVQLTVDLCAAAFVDRIGYRASMLIAHGFSAVGLFLLTVLPGMINPSFAGLLIAVVIYAVGGGLLEVLVSPIVEACPSENKEKTMSLLHSFYCWGHVGVVLASTAFFAVFGIENWRIMAWIWMLIPIVNFLLFTKVPIAPLLAEDKEGLTIGAMLKKGLFWILLLLMFCSGSCEQAVSQWASAFAEQGLHVSKMIGDLAGPMFFAIMMGLSRTFYGKSEQKINLQKFMYFSGLLCLVSYLIISLTGNPLFGFIGCGLCGLSVGILWPGTFSLASALLKGGTAMFALFALAGDLGCMGGPTFVGMISARMGDNLKLGILTAIIFPVLLLVGLGLYKRKASKYQVK